jgi:hypothetical protein
MLSKNTYLFCLVLSNFQQLSNSPSTATVSHYYYPLDFEMPNLKKDKKNRTPLLDRLRSSGRSKNQDSVNSSTATLATEGITNYGATPQPPSTVQSTSSVSSASGQQKPAFADILNLFISRDIAESMENSDENSFMEKVKEAGKTTWTVFKQVLEVVEAASPAFPPLQGAAGGLLKVLERCEVSVLWEYSIENTDESPDD